MQSSFWGAQLLYKQRPLQLFFRAQAGAFTLLFGTQLTAQAAACTAPVLGGQAVVPTISLVRDFVQRNWALQRSQEGFKKAVSSGKLKRKTCNVPK
eukprot:1161900-Pelagomonas_calceolata.AAC.12